MLDIDTCAAEARTLHPYMDGWFATLRKTGHKSRAVQKLHPMSSLDVVVRALDKAPDAYISQASFIRPRRLVSTFKAVNFAFVDIDCYSDKPNSPRIRPNEQFIEQLLANARAAGVPVPSYVTYSGRGVYCKWVFDKPIAAHELLRWQALQNVLTPLYTAFGVDASARDAARVLRVMGSTHGEADQIVRVGLNTNTVHNFDALCRAAEAVDVADLHWPTVDGRLSRSGAAKARKLRRDTDTLAELDERRDGSLGVLETYSASREPFMLKFGTRDHLNWSRFLDLRTLAELRGGIRPGSRDVMMFWMGTMLAHAGVISSRNVETEVRSLMGAFSGPDFDPISDRSMSSMIERLKLKEAGRTVSFKGGTYDPLYTPTNSHLIDILSISGDEQEHLITVIDGREKLRRADAKVEGRADRRQARVEWRHLARQLDTEAQAAGQPRNVAEIARQVGIDRRQVSRLLSGKLERDPLRTETRGRKRMPRTSGLVEIIVARFSLFTRSIWVDPNAASRLEQQERLTAKRSQPAQGEPTTALLLSPEADLEPAASPDRLSCLPDSDEHEHGHDNAAAPNIALSPVFKVQPFAGLALGFPHRVILSISRKERERKEAFSREEESKGNQAASYQITEKGIQKEASAKSGPAHQAFCEQDAPKADEAGVAETGSIIRPWQSLLGVKGARDAKKHAARAAKVALNSNASRPTGSTTIIKLKTTSGVRSRSIPVASNASIVPMSALARFAGDFTALRAEAERLTNLRKEASQAARIREQALLAAEREQNALRAANQMVDIQRRAFARMATESASASKASDADATGGAPAKEVNKEA